MEMSVDFTLLYLLRRFFHKIAEFFRHWYIDATKSYFSFFIDKLEDLDRYFAWKITFLHLFQPLYKDYSVLGYILGFFLTDDIFEYYVDSHYTVVYNQSQIFNK